jgi:solute carrier family 25 (mitochondrial oxoglutarate transporter), member 11
VVDAFSRIVKDEGIMGLWRGATPTVIRAMVLNLAMLATYDEAKELMLHTFKLYESETLELRIM